MRTVLAALALLLSVAGTPPTQAGGAPTIRCLGYRSLMKEAAAALREGNRSAALEKLRQARSLLDACGGRAESGSRLG